MRQQLQDSQARVAEYETHIERLSEAVKSAEEQVPSLESDIAAVKDVLETERAEVNHALATNVYSACLSACLWGLLTCLARFPF